MSRRILTWRNSFLTVLLAALGVAGCEKPEDEGKDTSTIIPCYGVEYASYQKVGNEENEPLDNISATDTLPIQNVATSDKTNLKK